MTIDQFRIDYKGVPEHEYHSAHNSCPWNPECDRGKAYMMGYLDRAASRYLGVSK